MPDFNGIPLWSDATPGPRGGALLYLAAKATDDAVILTDGIEVQTFAGSRVIQVRGVDERDLDLCLSAAIVAANKALDLFALGGFLTASLADPEVENIVWVESPDGVDLRLWCTVPMALRTGLATVEVRDSEGNLVEQVQPEPPVWHEGFRYFRLAQVTDDLFDAFRNLYLAMEAVLSEIAPQVVGMDGRPKEGEGEWFRRALERAGEMVDLSRYTASGDPVTALDDLYEEIYKKTRTAVFHAKTGRPVLIPLDAESRPGVMEALGRLSQLFIDLAEGQFGVRYRSGGIFAAGFRLMVQPVFQDSILHLRESEELGLDAGEPEIDESSPESTVPVELATDLEAPFFIAGSAEIAGEAAIAALPTIASLVLATPEGKPLLGHTLEGRLCVAGLARMTVVVGSRGTNTRMLRGRYGT